MFKNSKKILKEEIYLKDKYFFINESKNKKVIENESFLSDMQINTLLNNVDKNSKFNILKKTFENKVRMELIDILYALVCMVLLPLIISYLTYKHLFIANDVQGIIAYGGTFGAFMISGVLIVGMTSKIYEKFSGGTSFHEIKKVRGGKAFCEHIRENKRISDIFKSILNQHREMKVLYKEKTIEKDDKREFYDDIDFSEFSYGEKKLIKAIIKDSEDFL